MTMKLKTKLQLTTALAVVLSALFSGCREESEPSISCTLPMLLRTAEIGWNAGRSGQSLEWTTNAISKAFIEAKSR